MEPEPPTVARGAARGKRKLARGNVARFLSRLENTVWPKPWRVTQHKNREFARGSPFGRVSSQSRATRRSRPPRSTPRNGAAELDTPHRQPVQPQGAPPVQAPR